MMTAITNRSELCTAYELLKMIREIPEKYVGSALIEDEAGRLKDMIRRYHFSQETEAKGLQETTIGCGEDWQVDLCALPTSVRGRDGAREYVRKNIYLPTNFPYTVSTKIFKRGNRWMCYHKIGWSV